jgi:Zn-dependent protease with chaperone function
LPPEKLAKAIALGRIRQVLGLIGSLLEIAVYWMLLATGAASGLERWTQRLLRRRWMQGLLFFAVLIALVHLAYLPLGIYGHHVSLSYGIGVQGWGSWFVESLKGLGVALFGALGFLLFNWIVRVSPRRYWIWAWLVSLPLMVLMALAAPLLGPVFNKFEPLSQSHPGLVARLEQVVARTGTNIPPRRMFLMKASLKTNSLNAYVTGIGATKRFVLWDTTTDRLPDDEILFIFGHESGHYVLNHIPKGLACSAVGGFFVLWACAGLAGGIVRRYGQRWRIERLSNRAGFVVLLLTVSAAQFVLEPVSNAFSRHFEHEADVYGQEAIHGIVADPQKTAVAAFNHLGEASLDDPNPNAFIEFWTYSHPSVQHRAEFAQHYDPWAAGRKPQFFER